MNSKPIFHITDVILSRFNSPSIGLRNSPTNNPPSFNIHPFLPVTQRDQCVIRMCHTRCNLLCTYI